MAYAPTNLCWAVHPTHKFAMLQHRQVSAAAAHCLLYFKINTAKRLCLQCCHFMYTTEGMPYVHL
jgi:hypothetical protein